MTKVARGIGERILSRRLNTYSLLNLAALPIFDFGFSFYLTAVELFAIRTICTWRRSLVVMTTLLAVLILRPTTRLPEINKLA